MKASELISTLVHLIDENGDLPVWVPVRGDYSGDTDEADSAEVRSAVQPGYCSPGKPTRIYIA